MSSENSFGRRQIKGGFEQWRERTPVPLKADLNHYMYLRVNETCALARIYRAEFVQYVRHVTYRNITHFSSIILRDVNSCQKCMYTLIQTCGIFGFWSKLGDSLLRLLCIKL
jgi:hypothetical protein